MASIIRMTILFFILGLIAHFYDLSTATHIETIITLAVMFVLLPEKYHP